jgi:FkbM family methyltransferase
MFVSNLLGRARVRSFADILKRCERIDTDTKVYIDGGAGLGETVESILEATINNSGKIFAFEPNPQNVSRFRIHDPRVVLCEDAMSDSNGTAEFLVSSKTQENAENPYMQGGTSYVGKLASLSTDGQSSGDRYQVRTRRIDSVLAEHGVTRADFVKLDLQGAETEALLGMGDLLRDVKWMWIEFSNQPGLLDLLKSHGFVLFDTEYLFVGEPNDLIEELFEITLRGRNSIGKSIFFGYRRHVWRDFERAFTFARTKRRMIQTDLVAVHPDYLPTFLEAAIDLIPSDTAPLRWNVPRGLF